MEKLISFQDYQFVLLRPVWIENHSLRMVDQLLLPLQEEILTLTNVSQVCKRIKDMSIRGSGALGLAGACGMYLAWLESGRSSTDISSFAEQIKQTRTTAINLINTVEEMQAWFFKNTNADESEVLKKVEEIANRQLGYELALGKNGADLIQDGDNILTHCHSGALAGAGFGGRALSSIRMAWAQKKKIHVYVSETRPYFQGSRITAYELSKWAIPYTIITDSMSGSLMRAGKINKIIVGSDRVASNGDLINKVGSLTHALVAQAYGVPFYVATSEHTFDAGLPNGDCFQLEYRSPEEVLNYQGVRIAPPDAQASYPAFDITDHKLIKGYITEAGVLYPPFSNSLKNLHTHRSN